MSDYTVILGDGEFAVARLEAINQVYIDVFSQPPSTWDEEEPERHRERLTRIAKDPTFGIAVAQVEANAELIGFAYGRSVSVDNPRLVDFVTPVPEEVTAEWEGRTFILIDFAVRERWRGLGVGRALTAGLLGSRHEERAILGVEPQAVESKAIYEHLGWQPVGRKRQADNFVPFVDVYTLPLAGGSVVGRRVDGLTG